MDGMPSALLPACLPACLLEDFFQKIITLDYIIFMRILILLTMDYVPSLVEFGNKCAISQNGCLCGTNAEFNMSYVPKTF